jgi:hypothetical protein
MNTKVAMKIKRLILSLTAAMMVCAAEGQQPVTALSVNGMREAVVDSGWPVIVTATITGPEVKGRAESIGLTAAGPDGASIELPFVSRRGTAGTAAGAEIATAVWTLSPEAVSSLAPGNYRIEVSEGGVVASAVLLRVVSVLPPDQGTSISRFTLLSQWEEMQGHADLALEWADKLVREQPQALAGYVRRADLLTAAGRYEDALAALDEAETIYNRLEASSSHPPMLIRYRKRKLLDEILR